MSTRNLRPETAQHLAQRLRAFSEGFRQNLAMLGPPGSGKTHQLQQLLIQPPANLFIRYCPLYRDSSRSFLQRFLCAILRSAVAVAAPAAAEDPTRQASQTHGGSFDCASAFRLTSVTAMNVPPPYLLAEA